MKTNRKINLAISTFLVLFLFVSIPSVIAQDADQTEKEAKKSRKQQKKIKKQKNKFQKNRNKALSAVYKAYPGSQSEIAGAYGYAAFGNTGVNLFVLASGNGGGVAHSNASGAEVYVKMVSYGAGVGIGFKKYFAVFIFEDKAAYDNFLESGWGADTQADATAKTGKDGEGESVAVGLSVADGVTLYQVADKGFAVQATVQGTKFIVSDELNGTN